MSYREYQEQTAIFQWAKYLIQKYPQLELLHASQYTQSWDENRKMRNGKAGLKAGIPDIHLAYANNKYSSLWIELKAPKMGILKAGIVSDIQKEMIDKLNKWGNYAVVCFGAKEAIDTIINYLENKC